ncbi:DUF397 domain-containing protein [Streptomyces sp. TRM49041]|uniref:DUF397 domain-containing protein n=1 Tax=Streptomyces sp. TRM49041 TaxID=2603216 RepID=UPI0011ED8E12|nr:DUF397 domain-containing protein [Streptomyces sp. TRM49041]
MRLHQDWQKSSYCAEGDACIHLAPAPDGAVRLTETSDPTHAILTLTPAIWRTWSQAIKAGNLPTPGAHPTPHGTLHLRAPDGDVQVTTTTAQWTAFAAGVRAGEFDHLDHLDRPAATLR